MCRTKGWKEHSKGEGLRKCQCGRGEEYGTAGVENMEAVR